MIQILLQKEKTNTTEKFLADWYWYEYINTNTNILIITVSELYLLMQGTLIKTEKLIRKILQFVRKIPNRRNMFIENIINFFILNWLIIEFYQIPT